MKWHVYQIERFVNSGLAHIQTGPFGTQLKASDYVDQGTPVINVRNIGFRDLRPGQLEYVNGETADRLSVHILRRNDIVFGRKGAVERHLLVKSEQENWMQGSDCIRLRFLTDEVCPRFVSYALLLPEHQRWMLNQAGNKATMASLNQDVIRRIPLKLPPCEVQNHIADVLSSYDNLIESNRRRMELLEATSRLLYSEWFVRYRFPGYEHTRIVDGVPDGWERRRIKDLARVNQQILDSSFDGDIEYVDISSVSPGRIDETASYHTRDAPSRARRVVRHGDIIWSCVRPNRRSHAVIWSPPANLIVSTGFAVISPGSVPTSFLYQALTTDAFVRYLEQNARGAAYPAVVADDFERAEILVPQRQLIQTFDDIAEPLLTQFQLLRIQSQKLRAARDLLLPKLMSGELAV